MRVAFVLLLFAVTASAANEPDPASIYERFAAQVQAGKIDEIVETPGPSREYFESLTPEQLRGLYAFCNPEDRSDWSPTEREALRPHIAKRLGVLDREDAVQHFIDNRDAYHGAWTDAIGGWVTVDPEGAFDWGVAKDERRFIRVVLEKMGRLHRDKVMDIIDHPKLRQEERTTALVMLGSPIISRDGEEGWKWFSSLSEDDRKAIGPKLIMGFALALPEKAADLALESGEQLTDAIGYWALSDPAAACAWLQKLPEGETRENLHRLAVLIWSELDPERAWEHLSDMPVPEILAFGEGVIHTDRKYLDPPSRFNNRPYSRARPIPESIRLASFVNFHFHMTARAAHGERVFHLLAPRLTGEGGQALMEIVKKSENKDLVSWARMKEAYLLASTDPARALKLVQAADGNLSSFFYNVVSNLARTDPAAALQLALEFDREGSDEKWMASATRYAFIESPEKTAEAIAAMEESGARKVAQKKLLELEGAQRSKMAEYQKMPAGAARNRTFGEHAHSLHSTWSNDRIIDLVINYIGENEVAPGENWMGDSVIPMWVKQNPQSLAEWAVTQPESRRRHQALRAFWERWESFERGEGDRRLKALGLEISEIKSSKY